MAEELLTSLLSLAQLDTDAVSVYDEALEHVTDEDVKARFLDFRGEHEYHAAQLHKAIERLGGTPPELKVDMMGRIADWITSIRAMRGTEGALHAMLTAERYHNSRYAEVLAWDVDDVELASMLRRFHADEQHHLAFIESRLGEHAVAAT